MWPKHWIKGTEKVQHELRLWNGARAQAWAYSVSHSQLLVRIYRDHSQNDPSSTSLWLYLKDCHKVSFADFWRDADVRIEEQSGKYGAEFIVRDGDRLFVHCGVQPFAAESRELLRFEPPVLGTEL